MIKNDITYEYRVFTNRLVDVESMEVGICTSGVLNKLKPNDKIDGRFYHTSDTDEWFFCWKGEMQKLNLKGDSDINAALVEVEKLISEANAAVSDAKSTAEEAKNAAKEAKVAAESATEAVESIENKADKTEVAALEQEVSTKADKTELDGKADVSDVQELSDKVAAIKLDDYALKADVPSIDGLATESFVNEEIAKIEIPVVPTKVSELENDKNYLTEHQDISGKQDVIEDLEDIRNKANNALTEVPAEYITETELDEKGYLTSESLNGYATETFVNEKIGEISKTEVPTKVSQLENDAKYLTESAADLKYAPIGSEGVDLSSYATKDYVGEEIAKIEIPVVPTKVSQLENDKNYLTEHQDISGKQDVIGDLEDIRANASLGATALQEVPAEYITETELDEKGYLTAQSLEGYAKTEDIPSLENVALKSELPIMENYYTKEDIDGKFDAINSLIGDALTITNTILG